MDAGKTRRIAWKDVTADVRGHICSYLDIPGVWAFYTTFCHTLQDKEILGQCVSSLHTGCVHPHSTFTSLRESVLLLDPIGRSDGFAAWICSRTVPLRSIALFFPEDTKEASIDRIMKQILSNLTGGCYPDLTSFVVKVGGWVSRGVVIDKEVGRWVGGLVRKKQRTCAR